MDISKEIKQSVIRALAAIRLPVGQIEIVSASEYLGEGYSDFETLAIKADSLVWVLYSDGNEWTVECILIEDFEAVSIREFDEDSDAVTHLLGDILISSIQ